VEGNGGLRIAAAVAATAAVAAAAYMGAPLVKEQLSKARDESWGAPWISWPRMSKPDDNSAAAADEDTTAAADDETTAAAPADSASSTAAAAASPPAAAPSVGAVTTGASAADAEQSKGESTPTPVPAPAAALREEPSEDDKVGRCRFTVSKHVLNAPMVSALETII